MFFFFWFLLKIQIIELWVFMILWTYFWMCFFRFLLGFFFQEYFHFNSQNEISPLNYFLLLLFGWFVWFFWFLFCKLPRICCGCCLIWFFWDLYCAVCSWYGVIAVKNFSVRLFGVISLRSFFIWWNTDYSI